MVSCLSKKMTTIYISGRLNHIIISYEKNPIIIAIIFASFTQFLQIYAKD